MNIPDSNSDHGSDQNWQIQVLARTLWGEARGETQAGREAVAAVIVNRAARRKMTIASVCLFPLQFSCWNLKDPNRGRLIAVTDSDGVFAECLAIAEMAVLGALDDATDGADHYFNPALVRPAWAAAMTKTASIGHHDFYRS